MWAIIFRDALLLPDPNRVEDFTGFYIGATLLGTPDLYSVPANLRWQKSITGMTNPGVIYVRPPFFAVLLRPFTMLSYRSAVVLWKGLVVAALAGFVCLFPLKPRRYAALAVCLSFPAALSLWRANDAAFLLVLIGASLSLWNRNRALLAGVALGLCLAKFHFLLFLGLLFWQRRYWRVLEGFAIVSGLALAVNFWVQPSWIASYWSALTLPQANLSARAAVMPNIYASFVATGYPGVAAAIGLIPVGYWLWRICRRLPFELAMPLCIFGGLLTAPHTNSLDAILAIPALLLTSVRFPSLRLLTLGLLSPLAAVLYCIGPPILGPGLFVTVSLWVLIRLAKESVPGGQVMASLNTGDMTPQV